jgi:hypothetical protein
MRPLVYSQFSHDETDPAALDSAPKQAAGFTAEYKLVRVSMVPTCAKDR